MAKLTVYQRNEIVDDILADTGVQARIDDLEKRLSLEFQNAYWAALPKAIQALRGTSHEHYLQMKSIMVDESCACLSVKVPYRYTDYRGEDETPAGKARTNSGVRELHRAYEAAVKEGKELKDLTRAYVYSCSTAAQFKTRFPELAKYLPRVEAPTANLPATTEFTDRLKAAGLKLGE